MPRFALAGILAIALALPVAAATPDNGGPYNASFLAGGVGIERELKGGDALVAAGAAYTISAWVKPDIAQEGIVPLVVLGDMNTGVRALVLSGGAMAMDGDTSVTGDIMGTPVTVGKWTHLAAVSDGAVLRLYVDGREINRAPVPSVAIAPRIGIAPVIAPYAHFGGSLVDAQVQEGALGAEAVRAMAANPPDFDVVQIWHVGVGWEWQKQANTGYWRQQDPWTLPQGKGGFSKPVAKPVPVVPALMPVGAGRWQINGWRLAAAPDVTANGAALSRPGFDTGKWWAATVPGTVLTTLVDRGVYPDPYYGLNNLGVPEKLSRQDYWYRTGFTFPAEAAGKRLTLVFNGVNYASEIWLNGVKLGGTTGAFIRGRFDIVPAAGENVLAVRVMPPPHPGIPHEQSIRGGVGENGGQMAIDGPTFVDTEGWDWIPGIRDRDTGIWLPVELEAHGDVVLGDPQIVTDLPLPQTDSADIYIRVPVTNLSSKMVFTTVTARFDDISVGRSIDLQPGTTMVSFSPWTDTQLRIHNPKLWWPNGYGEPALHDMVIAAGASDSRHVRFGIREVSYDLSLFDSKGALRRVNVQPTEGGLHGEKLIDVTHTGIKLSPRGYAESLTAAGEASPGVTDLGPADTLPEPHLAIRVNGVKIAARGGSWGMDDAMKRIGRDRLAPAFRLEREAHMNIIRNWMGTNTEPVFYDLADENGMMVLNDFWQSTQNFQVEPQDPALFVANVRDTVSRYRNHPSIVVWFGRNEGVPYPMLNEGIDDAIAELDGTRWYTGSSNTVNLQGSGPYNYRPPAGYFTDLATGFSVETGTPSLSTIDSIKSYVPQADRWPLSDTLAYHDWHFAGNGDTRTFMAALDTMFGAGTSLEDFERKAQMMNLETHKAMVEGFLGHLWTKNSGRLFWMAHPSWPSNAWQLYSWDFDTHAAYYGAKKAAEPLHVQLNLPDNALVVLNTTREDARGLKVFTRVVSLDNRVLFTRTDTLDALANRATPLAPVPLDTIFAKEPMVLVRLLLLNDEGSLVSDNLYWRGREPGSYRALNAMPQVALRLAAGSGGTDGQDELVRVVLQNQSPTPALNAKLTLVNGRGERILPAFYSDNYVSLLPGETKVIQVRYPARGGEAARFMLSGWNVVPQRNVPVK